MFFIKANKDSASALKLILAQYETASVQTINASKSAITFSRKAPPSLKESIKECLQIQKEGDLGKYLGLPEHFGRRKRDLFSSIVDRIKIKANGWSNRHLSSARKIDSECSNANPVSCHDMLQITCLSL